MDGTQHSMKPSRRARKKEEHRRGLYAAAVELFRERGYDDVTVLDITEKADLSKGTFFNHYESKAHVLLQYGRELSTGLLEYGRRLRGNDPQNLFDRFFRHMERTYRAEGSFIDVLVRQLPFDSQMQSAHRRGEDALLELYRDFLLRGIRSGHVREDVEPDLVAELLRDIWLSTLRVWVAAGHDFSLRSRVEEKVALVFQGLAARDRSSGSDDAIHRRKRP